MLQQVLSLPVAEWRYKGDAPASRYIGPMAEDFQAVLGLGNGETVPLSDATGLALASVQGFHEQIAERYAQIARLEERLAALEQHDAQLSLGLSQANAELLERLTALETRLVPQRQVVALDAPAAGTIRDDPVGQSASFPRDVNPRQIRAGRWHECLASVVSTPCRRHSSIYPQK